MVKIIIDADQGTTLPGRRTPEDEIDWLCNDKVVRAVIAKLETYKDVEILRVDDPTGKVDIPLQTRTNRASEWKADFYVSIYHNALLESWGEDTGFETYAISQPEVTRQPQDSTSTGYPRIVKTMEIRDRGHKPINFHVLREAAIPAILTEGGLIDSVVDIIKLRDENYLLAEGEAIAKGLATYIKLQPNSAEIDSKSDSVKGMDQPYNPTAEELVEATTTVLQHLESDSEGVIPLKWLKKIQDGTLTDSDSVCLLYVVIHRWLSEETDL